MSNNLCKSCKNYSYRAFRIWEVDEESPEGSLPKEQVIVAVTCILLDVDISGIDTFECNKFEPLEE